MELVSVLASIIALLLFGQTVFSVYLMMFTWERPERLAASQGPQSFLQPRLSFSVLVPARHEEAVIYQTVERITRARYPADMLEIVVICQEDDAATIAEVQRATRELNGPVVRLETFAEGPINKPRGLNVGFKASTHEVVTIFDAEDDVDQDIFNVVNTVMLEEEVGIVQGGVQLMNFRDHWFGLHNCLEYFFWFKSRLHFHAQVGMIPLGGNTVFLGRHLIERVGGWDEGCLTEDAEIGLRLSALGEPIRVVYDARHVTREETPATMDAFLRQRTRWCQGFLQVTRKGYWRALAKGRQRALAIYTLSYPILQAVLLLLWPVTLAAVLLLKLAVPVVMITFLPLYALALQFIVTLVGAYGFTREYRQRAPLLTPLTMAITFIPFQWMLGIGALRAVRRELSGLTNWEKTAHLGAHRETGLAPASAFSQLLDEARDQLGAERGSVLLLNADANSFSVLASRGLPEHVTNTGMLDARSGVAAVVAHTGRPAILDGSVPVPELRGRLKQPALRSSIVLPIEHGDSRVAVLSISSELTSLGEDALHWLTNRVETVSRKRSLPAAV
jgi:cellulose synthase/poly-beta-1,6-N-acetylglucosamine synthase-like glycosyltransferase